MPNLDSICTNKKKNIGNDFVTIVYNESGQDYDIQTVKVSTYYCKSNLYFVSFIKIP